MEVAVPEEPQKKIFRARKTMKMSDRQQLEVLHGTLTSTGSNASSPSSRPETPLVNGTHEDDGQELDKESGSKSPMSECSPPPSRSLSRSSSPAVGQNVSPSPALKDSENGEGKREKGDEKKDMRPETSKDEKTEISKSASTGCELAADSKNDVKKEAASNGDLSMDTYSTGLDHVSAEEKSSKSSSSSPFGSPAASLECDPEVKEGFLCLSEEDEGQGEQDEVKEEKMDVELTVKKEAEKGSKAADGTGNATPVGKKRSLSPVEMNDDCKDKDIKEERDGKRARVEGVQLEAQLELKITANAGSQLKLQKVVQQLVEERLRVLQLTVFDRSLQELKDRVDKIDATTKQQNTVQHTLQSKIARLAKKFGAANQATENSKKEPPVAAKAAPVANTTPTTHRTIRTTLDQKQLSVPPGSSSSTATPTQPKPLSTPTTPTSSALGAPAPILQIISTTTNSTPSSSSSSLSGQAQTGALLLQPRTNTGGMTNNTATTAGQPVSIQPLLIQLPLAMANGQGGAIAGGVNLIPVSSLASVSSISKAKTTTATTFILQKTSGNLVPSSSSTPLSSLSSTTVTQMPQNRMVYQGGTVTASSPSAGISVSTARAPAQSAAVVGMATVSSSPATTGPAATGSAAAVNGPPSASEMASKTDNQATNLTPAKSAAQPGRPKGSVIDLTEDDDDVQVTSVQKAAAAAAAASANPTTTPRAQGPTPSLVSSTSVARPPVQHRPTVDSPSKSRSGSTSGSTLPPLPIAPPPPTRLPVEAAHTSPPQQPQLKLARVQSQNGIVLSWCVSETERSCAPVDSYHLYAYHQDQQAAAVTPSTQSSSHSLWKKIGEVKALPLPMACTLTQFVSGSTYYFAVRAKDVYGRFGPFCEPQCTDVINPPTSSAS